MAAWLEPRLPASTRILVSPALRCQETAQALGRTSTTVDAIGPARAREAVLARRLARCGGAVSSSATSRRSARRGAR
jgi:phosphohistidine phosphatase SixA